MDSFGARSVLRTGDREYEIFSLESLAREGLDASRLPYSLRILLENLLRQEDGIGVTAEDITALASWRGDETSEREIGFLPARTLMQDFTGVPAIVDLAAMRDAMASLGGDPSSINPLHPVELVIDHSVQVDAFGSKMALRTNQERDYERNGERYAFLKWGQRAFENFRVVPPNTGICHQVNLEYLARVVFGLEGDGGPRSGAGLALAYPDTVIGTDSHTPMVNGLGVLGWGVGGIEAEAAMLGQPISMLIPDVIGFRLSGDLPEGATATDLVLTVAELLRAKGVVGKFVEFYGSGIANLALADRATIGNMSPEYGATCAIFPVDQVTLEYLRFTGRAEERLALVESYMKEQGLFHTADSPEPDFTDTLELDLGSVEPSIAGPRRPQDRIRLTRAGAAFREALPDLRPPAAAPPAAAPPAAAAPGGVPSAEPATAEAPSRPEPAAGNRGADLLRDGSVVIAAITSCTNTSNPSVMLAAGLLARNAVRRGLETPSWVKTSLAPGSRVVTEYYERAGFTSSLEKLGFHLVGYGCTTCIGNSGPLPESISAAIAERGLVTAAVLSGNRNFEARIHPEVRANYLMSPPLVVAFALAGRIDIDLYEEPLGRDPDGRDVFLRDIWPTREEIRAAIHSSIERSMFEREYTGVYEGDDRWKSLPIPEEERYAWSETSDYVRQPPFFLGMPRAAPRAVEGISGARVLAWFGDSITTDHISPAGGIARESPAGRYLVERGVEPTGFNSYGSRRGNHEVMLRGTFANVRIRNRLVPGTEGGVTMHFPSGEVMTIFEAAMRYRSEDTPLIVLAGEEYGSGSSRDWAAKGPRLQGVAAVIARGFERIHRSNLIGMGVLPLQFEEDESAESLGLSGRETFEIEGIAARVLSAEPGGSIPVRAHGEDSGATEFRARVRLDTPREVQYYRNGGILQFALRQLLSGRGDGQAGGMGTAGGMATAAQVARGEHAGPALVDEASRESFPASDSPAYPRKGR